MVRVPCEGPRQRGDAVDHGGGEGAKHAQGRVAAHAGERLRVGQAAHGEQRAQAGSRAAAPGGAKPVPGLVLPALMAAAGSG
jgi:hypothetical protein